MELTEESEAVLKHSIRTFINKVKKARALKSLPELHHHDLTMYCQTLINGCSLFQLINSMECSDRFDLVGELTIETMQPLDSDLNLGFCEFSKKYLGLDLFIQGDPRGSAFKLIVDPSLGDSWGDRTHLCVPCVDCYQSL